MANEATIRISVTVKKGNIDYQPRPTGYSYDVSGEKGPTPGAFTVPAGGKAISLTELTTPGPCWMTNYHDTVPVDIGIRDPDNSRFYPFIELQPGGKPQYVYLSRNLLEEYQGTGTGTVAGNQLFALPQTENDVDISVEAFER